MIIRDARLEDAAAIGRVYVDGWRSTYPGIVPDEYLNRMSYDEHKDRWIRILGNAEGYVYVAEADNGDIAGFIWGGSEPNNDPVYKGELYAIYVRKEYHGQKLGTLLTRRLAEKLVEEGMRSVIVWVLAQNSSRRFYESLGAVQVRTGPYIVGGYTLDDVAYGWTDIGDLLKRRM